jgi:polyphosphate kinase
MDRNFFRRVETCFPIEDAALKNHVIKEGLLTYLSDNTNAWVLQSNGNYKKLKRGSQKPKCAQQILIDKLAERKN